MSDVGGEGAPLHQVSRRGFLAGGAAVTVALTTGGVLLGSRPAAADTYSGLRDRWCDIITGASDIDAGDPDFQAALSYLDSRVQGYLDVLDRSSGRTRVFTGADLVQRADSSRMTGTYNGLHWMARGWYTPGSAFHHDPDLAADILAGLATVHQLVYNTGVAWFDNWWDFCIGSPKRLADILLLLDTQLSATVRERYAGVIRHFVPDPKTHHNGNVSLGGNRTAMCGVVILQGIASRDPARIAQGTTGLPDTYAYVTGDKSASGAPGEGLWADGSYIQHQSPYTGAYGRGLLTDISLMSALLAGSTWELDDPAIQNIYDAVERAYAPVIHDGRMMSFVNGRMVSYPNEQEHPVGLVVIGAILRMARGNVTDAATIERWKRRCRGWVERSSYNPYTGAEPSRVGLIKELMAGPITPLPEPEDSVIFRNMARAVHRRAGWAFAISMNSNRIAHYESINGENLRGWHTGAGMTYLYDGDSTQYTDGYWPTVHPQRHAGITVDRTTIPDGDGDKEFSPWKWAGGAVLDAKYSAVGMSLQSARSNLLAKKSWFCFDEYIFCMGRGISGGGGTPVETIVENRNLHASGTNRLIVGGQEWTGADETVADPVWAHLEGVGGYIFPSSAGQKVRIQRGSRTGSWRDINATASTTPVTRRWLGMAVQHGVNPVDGLYSYLVVPKATPERTRYLATVDRGISILGHNTNCHAVRQPGTGLTMINFWRGPHTVGGVGVSRDCAVIVQELNGTLRIAVADPLRGDSTVRVTVTPALTGYRLVSKEDRVTVVSVGTSIVLDVATSVYGRTYVAAFARA